MISETDQHLQFATAFGRTVLENLQDQHGAANWDYLRFGRREDFLRRALKTVCRTANLLLRPLGVCLVRNRRLPDQFESVMRTHGQGLADLYSMLDDAYSKRLLIEVIAYRLLGYSRMKLSTNPALFQALAQVRKLTVAGDHVDPHFRDWQLSRFDLSSLGYPISLYAMPTSIASTFLRRDYAYERITPPVGPSAGDYVIDAGAAWGDTALFFAWKAGATGRVFSFELEPVNLTILQRNLELNPDLAPRIEVVAKALWSKPDVPLSFASNGPGTRVGETGASGVEHTVTTTTIDAVCRALPRVDFIKMDIEGAELPALHGAVDTLRRFHPRLAISLYHNLEDFTTIPRFLAGLNLDYRYYLGHFSIHQEETILFAAPRTPPAR